MSVETRDDPPTAAPESPRPDPPTATPGAPRPDPPTAAPESPPTAAPAALGTDPLVGDLRRAGLLSLLVLHYAALGPCYGNRLMERIAQLTDGALVVNPNTMYPLLRALEAQGLLRGRWEHPERRSRRFYDLTPAGEEERQRLAAELGPRLDRIARSIEALRAEVLG